MAERTNTNRGLSGPPKQAAGSEQQDTMLLGDVPDVSELMPEASAQAANAPHLSSAALAALSQRYEILGEAGHGSMGNVYKARDRETGEIVALKLLKPEIASDQAMMDRFKNELLFARKITHKNVCRVHEFNRLGGIAYTSMEFVEGESLRSVLNRFGGLPVRKATDLALQICSGLKEAHAQGIVHRDLKPENIMIDAQGNVKIMDFGIARSMEAVTRMTGSMVGTPAYMAPEQVAGKPVDYRTDIYSLGLILYEMFTGTAAFRADNAVAVALKQMRESPVPPHEIDPQIPVPIERAILKCLEKEPAKRFQSISELESALRPQGAAPAATLIGAPPAPVSSTHSTQATLPLPSPPLRLMPPPRKRVSPVGLGCCWFLLRSRRLPGSVPRKSGRQPQCCLHLRRCLRRSRPLSRSISRRARPHSHHLRCRCPCQSLSWRSLRSQPWPNRLNRRHRRKMCSSAPTRRSARANPEGRLRAWTIAPATFGSADSNAKIARASAAKKIEDLGGLSARVVSRQNESGKFFVVWTGPFAAKSLPGIIDWLQAQGFAKARAVRTPGNGMMGLRDQGQNGEPWRKANPAPNP